MALAILSYHGTNEAGFNFTADVGTNGFYQYVIGKTKTSVNGLSLLDDISMKSRLIAAEPAGPFDSSFSLDIPADVFSGNPPFFVQLISYRDLTRRSPTFSGIVEVIGLPALPSFVPTMQFLPINDLVTSDLPVASCRSITFNYRSAAFTKDRYWRVLLETGQKMRAGEMGKADKKRIDAVLAVAGRKLHQAGTARMMQARKKQTDKPGLQHPDSCRTSSSFSAISDSNKTYPIGKATGQPAYNHNEPLTDSLAAWISPVFRQSPALFQMQIDHPVKLLNAVAERAVASRDFAYDYFKTLLADHSRKLLLDELINNGASTNLIHPISLGFSASQAVSIQFIQTDPLTIQGKPKFVYHRSSAIRLLLSLSIQKSDQPPMFSKAIVQLMVKDSVSLELLLEKKYKFKNLSTVSPVELDLQVEDLTKLPVNKDLLVSASFIWQEDQKLVEAGTFSNAFIFLCDGFFFKQMGAAVSGEIPLNDVVLHRHFWHKIWEGGGNNKRWVLEVDVKYLCAYSADQLTNGRMETRLQLEEEELMETRTRLLGKLKTGLEVSPQALNTILPQVSSYAAVQAEQLQALMTDELEPVMNQEANLRIELKGKKDERGVIWVYPEITIHEIILQKITNSNEWGQVLHSSDETVHFPRISSLHFIGAKTDSD